MEILHTLGKHFEPDEQTRVAEHVNKDNIGFLPDLLKIKCFSDEPYTDLGINLILKKITPDNSPKLKQIINEMGDEKKTDLLPYEIVAKLEGKKNGTNLNFQRTPDFVQPFLPEKPTTIRSIVDAKGNKIKTELFPSHVGKENGIKNIEGIEKISDPAIRSKKTMLERVFSKTFKAVHLETSTNPEVLNLEKEMSKLGVKVTFADDLNTAKAITNAAKQMKSQGIALPKEVILMTPVNKHTHGFTPIMRKGFESEAQVFIKKGLGDMKEIADPFFKERGMKHFTVESAEGTFMHEVGHYNHLQNISLEECPKIWNKMVAPEDKMKIAEEVSVHAMVGEDGVEFVPEVFSGLASGQKYSDKVMDIYKALKGPSVN